MNKDMYDALASIISVQQRGKEGTDVFAVGEQLKDLAANEPRSCELLIHDLQVKKMDLTAAARKIKDYADKHRTGNFAYVSPATAEGILRKFYGLPSREEARAASEPAEIDLSAFL